MRLFGISACAAALLAWTGAAHADGVIKGTVKVNVPVGYKPAVLNVNIDEWPCCRSFVGKPAETSPCAGSKKHHDDSLRIGKGGGLANVVVYLDKAPVGGKRDWSFLTKELKYEIDFKPIPPMIIFGQKFCRFEPHLLLVPTGWHVKTTSSDPVVHNTHTISFNNAVFNTSLAAAVLNADGTVKVRSELTPFVAAEADRIKVVCDVHNWMSAWWVVVDHPYVGVTDADGNFTIDQVPPGKYVVKTWHEKFGNRHAGRNGVVVTVVEGQATEVKDLTPQDLPK